MAGKGRKRREKNYRAAHGGLSSRLPPPPELSSVDALPSKLRKIIAFSSSFSSASQRPSAPTCHGFAKAQVVGKKKAKSGKCGEELRPDTDSNSTIFKPIKENEDESRKSKNENNDSRDADEAAEQKKKRKRKKTQVDDLRFAADLEKLGLCSSRRKRKKEYLKAKKKKQKKGNAQDSSDAPRHDIVKFGEIVKAPPKLVTVPKAPKRPLVASQERLRLQAVEAYRTRRKWISRPGIHLLAPDTESSPLQ